MIQTFLHLQKDDKRSDNQKLLTQKLATKLTQLNTKRLLNNNYSANNISSSKQNISLSLSENKKSSNSGYLEKITLEKKHLFICICGIPTFQNQFKNLQLPGQRIILVTPGFQLQLSEQQLGKRAVNSSHFVFADEINQKINSYPKYMSLIFIYHSFGTFAASFYFQKYYKEQKNRIKGIIEIGAGPIRMYNAIKEGLSMLLKLDKSFVLENLDFIYAQFNKDLQQLRKRGYNFMSYKSKYNFLSLFMNYKGQNFQQSILIQQTFTLSCQIIYLWLKRRDILNKKFRLKSNLFLLQQKCQIELRILKFDQKKIQSDSQLKCQKHSIKIYLQNSWWQTLFTYAKIISSFNSISNK